MFHVAVTDKKILYDSWYPDLLCAYRSALFFLSSPVLKLQLIQAKKVQIMPLSLQRTADGSHTLFSPEFEEHFHSLHGAIGESMHVFIQNGLQLHPKKDLHILEMGFGTGLNTLLTAMYGRQNIHYTAIDVQALDPELLTSLNYPQLLDDTAKGLWIRLHEIPWKGEHRLRDSFILKKIKTDLRNWMPPEQAYDLVYYDAFSPAVQPELWGKEIIQRIAGSLREAGIFVSYSAHAALRRNLESAGMQVDLLEGPPGKRQMTRGKKK